MDYLGFGVVTISNWPSFTTNQANLNQKPAAALSANLVSKEPHCSLIFSTTVPFSSEFGEVIPE